MKSSKGITETIRSFYYSDDLSAPVSSGKLRHQLSLSSGILGRTKPMVGTRQFAVCVDKEGDYVYASLHLIKDAIAPEYAEDVWGPGTGKQYRQYTTKVLIDRTLVCKSDSLPKVAGHPSIDNGPVITYIYKRLKEVA